MRAPNTTPEGRTQIVAALARCEEVFLRMIEDGIYRHPASPYLRLLTAAGVDLTDLRRLVQDVGIEGALGQLYDAGVYVTAERAPLSGGALSASFNQLRG